MQPSSIVTLITDFGLQDPYVGQMKGTLLAANREALIVDITHAVSPHDILSAGYALAASYVHFPSGTVHLIVVDPGVGSDRRILAAQGDGHMFICPDNGILSPLLELGKLERVYAVGYEQPGSYTFHGRDIMAPLAGRLAKGEPCENFGKPVALEDCVTLSAPGAVRKGSTLLGEVIRIDHFGNVRTSLRKEDLEQAGADIREVTIGHSRITSFCRTYAEIVPGLPAILIDSDGFIEIAANQARAADLLEAAVGDQVVADLHR